MENIEEQLESYCLYLKLIHERMLDKFFKEQAPYLCCKKGCSHCCEKGQYPMSEIEFLYIMLKFSAQNEQIKEEVLNNIQMLIREKNECGLNSKDFFYKCPFLINNFCCVYDNRAIICRTHGLMFFIEDNDGDEKYKIPYCVNLNLNYSKVYDKNLKTITDELIEKSGINIKPHVYNISLKTLTKKEITKNLGFQFGEFKPLIEWFM